MKYWDSPGGNRGVRLNGASGSRRPITSGGSLKRYPFLRTFYQHQAEIGGGLQKFLFFLVLATLLYVFVLGDAGVIRIMTLNREKARLETDVASVQVDIERLQTEINRLKNDPFMMEKLGREFYGYAAPGDRVYKLVPSQENK